MCWTLLSDCWYMPVRSGLAAAWGTGWKTGKLPVMLQA